MFSGELFLSGDLDRETRAQYVLNISAIDGGESPNTAFVLAKINILDVNDNPPSFSRSTYRFQIPESEPVGTVIELLAGIQEGTSGSGFPGRISASDPDEGDSAEIRYEILQGVLRRTCF